MCHSKNVRVFLFVSSLALLVVVCLLCVFRPDPIGNMMYVVLAGDIDIAAYFWLYRAVSFYILMIVITVFASVDFSSASVPEYSDRLQSTFRQNFGIICYCLAWFGTIVSQCTFFRIVFLLNEIDDDKDTNRDILGYLVGNQLKEAQQLIEFGVKFHPIDKVNERRMVCLLFLCLRSSTKMNHVHMNIE